MAVQWIGSLSDAELLDYLPQLVQVGGLAFCPVLVVPPPGPQDRLYPTGTLLGVEYGQSAKPPVSYPGLKVRMLPGQPLGALPPETSGL